MKFYLENPKVLLPSNAVAIFGVPSVKNNE
jgi:hypothetical protein